MVSPRVRGPACSDISPPLTPRRRFAARKHNFDNLAALADCLEAGTCKAGQRKVVLFGSYNFAYSLMGHVSGENIWCVLSLI